MLPKLEPCAGRAATPTICGRRRRFLVIGGPPPLIYRRAPMPLSVYFFEKGRQDIVRREKKILGILTKLFRRIRRARRRRPKQQQQQQ